MIMESAMGMIQPADQQDRREAMVDVSHGIGIPFGGIGTGYSVYGKYGFVNVNFNSFPDKEQHTRYSEVWQNYRVQPKDEPPFAFVLREKGAPLVLQETPLSWLNAETASRVTALALLPKGFFAVENSRNLDINIEAFSPLIPHDLAGSTIPAQVFDITVRNGLDTARELTLSLQFREKTQAVDNAAVAGSAEGAVALACTGGRHDETGAHACFSLEPGGRKTIRFIIAWYYPVFNTPSRTAPDAYKRWYTRRFTGAVDVITCTEKSADLWSRQIDEWHGSFDVPAYFKRLWFSSLCSVITSTMMSADPYFFELETPHNFINTMDVTVYSGWIYLINWPELEKFDMNQYLSVIPTEGKDAGMVWHDLWAGGADYMEEPVFPARIYRDYLWYNDRPWLESAYKACVLALERAYQKGHYEYLLSSAHGNQSYDCWKMPGVSSYVNSAWIFSLYALDKMADILGKSAVISGIPVKELMEKAFAGFNKVLWNDAERRWDCFFRTPGAKPSSVPETSFLDQLFGLWLLLVDPDAKKMLPAGKVESALNALYKDNLIDDPENGFRGWANGMLPGGVPDMKSGYHSRTCWICAQLDLGSLLGAYGDEEKALDIFKSLENSLQNNHLAVGEWNRSADENRKSRVLPEETGKDTPRFPPYPRYKCSWEYLPRILGLTLDQDFIYLNPCRSFSFSLKNITLAGTPLAVSVEKDWNTVLIDGAETTVPYGCLRGNNPVRVEFRKR